MHNATVRGRNYCASTPGFFKEMLGTWYGHVRT